MIVSMLALIFGVSSFPAALARASQGQNPVPTIVVGLSAISGAVAYRSRKRRLLGLRPDTSGRVVFEIACLTWLLLAWLPPALLLLDWLVDPIQPIVSVWALAAYSCAGMRIRPDRMIGSTLALICGVGSLLVGLAGLASEDEGAVTAIVLGLTAISGAVAYRSRKRRLLGLRPDTQERVIFEIACLACLALLPMGLLAGEGGWGDPGPHFVSVWALAAYFCAGLRIHPDTPDTSERQ